MEEHRQQEETKAARELLDIVLGRLPAKDRMALTLVHLEGRSVGDAAELLGWSAVNVKVRAHRARRAMKGMIEKLMNERGVG